MVRQVIWHHHHLFASDFFLARRPQETTRLLGEATSNVNMFTINK